MEALSIVWVVKYWDRPAGCGPFFVAVFRTEESARKYAEQYETDDYPYSVSQEEVLD